MPFSSPSWNPNDSIVLALAPSPPVNLRYSVPIWSHRVLLFSNYSSRSNKILNKHCFFFMLGRGTHTPNKTNKRKYKKTLVFVCLFEGSGGAREHAGRAQHLFNNNGGRHFQPDIYHRKLILIKFPEDISAEKCFRTKFRQSKISVGQVYTGANRADPNGAPSDTVKKGAPTPAETNK